MVVDWMKRIGKITLWVGSTLVLIAIAGASTVTYPNYSLYYFVGTAGLSLMAGGLLTLLNSHSA